MHRKKTKNPRMDASGLQQINAAGEAAVIGFSCEICLRHGAKEAKIITGATEICCASTVYRKTFCVSKLKPKAAPRLKSWTPSVRCPMAALRNGDHAAASGPLWRIASSCSRLSGGLGAAPTALANQFAGGASSEVDAAPTKCRSMLPRIMGSAMGQAKDKTISLRD